ncbi:MAG TPA: hypothetical protein VLB81_15345 [Gaiellales bacterium]|nr:hypothetical protein [Gaiellales bacterium]
MTTSPSLLVRAMFAARRGFLAVLALLLGAIVGGVAIIPFTIFVLPLPIILGGLLVLYVLGSTSGMADDWHARRQRRRRPGVAADAERRPRDLRVESSARSTASTV